MLKTQVSWKGGGGPKSRGGFFSYFYSTFPFLSIHTTQFLCICLICVREGYCFVLGG